MTEFEQACAIWALYCEVNALRSALSVYEPNTRRGLPSPAVTRMVSEARVLMLGVPIGEDRDRITDVYESVLERQV